MDKSKTVNVALFDVCNTLVDRDTLGDFTEHFLLSRSRNRHFKFSAWAYHFIWRFLRGRTHLIDALSGREHDIFLFKGFSESQLSELGVLYAEHLRSCMKKPVVEELNQLKKQGYQLFLVSAGLDLYLHSFAEFLGAGLVCTKLRKDDAGFYEGLVEGVDCIGEGKVTKMKQEIDFFDVIDWGNSFAFGDNSSDIPMLSLVGHATVVDPNTTLREHALKHDWRVITVK